MHRFFDQNPVRSSLSENSHTRTIKVLYIALCLQIVMFSIVFHSRYPLTVTETLVDAYGYWFLVVSSIVSATLLAYYSRAAIHSFVATAVFYVTMDSHQVLYYSVVGGDHTGEIIGISEMAQFTNIGPDLSSQFGYLSWPNSYIFAILIRRMYEIGDIVTTLDIGYRIYFMLLAVSVWLFAYRVGNGFFAYLSSVSYLVVSFTVINKQFVPQFLALIFLFFLLYLIHKRGFRWRIIEFTLYVSLVFTHPFFPIFYPLALTLRPAVTSISKQYRTDTRFEQAYQVFLAPTTLLRRLLSPSTWRADDANMYVRIFGLWLIYFVTNPPYYIRSTFLSPRGETVGSPLVSILSNIVPFVQSRSGGDSAVGAGATTDPRLLYELAPKSIDTVVTWGSRFVIVSLFAILLVSILFNDISDHLGAETRGSVDYRGEVVVACGVLFVASELLATTYGMRVLQVAFLPVALFFYGLRNHTRTVVIAIVCFSLLSPVILSNLYINVAIGAGGNSISYQETQTARTVGEYYEKDVIVPPHTVAPLGDVSESRRLDIRRIRRDDFVIPESGPMVYSERFSYYIESRRYDCELDTQTETVVYDSNIPVIWRDADDRYLQCIRDEVR